MMRDKRKRATLKIWFQTLPIYRQISLAMSILSIVTITVLGIVIFSISKRTIETNYQSAHRYNLQVSSNIIELQLKSIVDRGRGLLNDETFKKALLSEENLAPYFSSQNGLVIDRKLTELASYETAIQSMLIINVSGSWCYMSKNTTESGNMDHYYTSDVLLEEKWVSVAKEKLGKEVFYGYNVLFENEKNDTFSMVKQMINPIDHKPMGYMVINIKKSMLSKAFGREEDGYVTNRYMILDLNNDENGVDGEECVVYFGDSDEVKMPVLEEYLAGMDNGTYLYSTYHNETSSWDIVNVIEKSELSRDSDYIGWSIIIAALALIVISLIVSKVISGQISKPLKALERMIQEVGNGKYSIQEEFDEGEVGRIASQFQDMVHNNLELRERLLQTELKEREAELLVLQSQINPHFLYNTLDSLYFMAIMNNVDDIAQMVLALSDTFKLSLNQGKKVIRVRDEIEKIKAYMKIQNFRYHNRFELQLDIQEEIMELEILSFILQPVVENAMYHGLEAKIGKGWIRIEGTCRGDLIYFVIRDNGVGMENLTCLDKGYGVNNIRERIHLFYGKQYDVVFESTLGQGTTVTFAFPMRKGET